jgi:AcrR family transcriptional regulator
MSEITVTTAAPGRRSPRMSADQRRPVLLDAAVAEFAHAGLAGARTDAIARRAGISQSYVFRLYPTKLDLFLAAVEREWQRVEEAFAAAAAEVPAGPDRLAAMARAYKMVLTDRDALLFQLQTYAASADEPVRRVVREAYLRLFRLVERVSGASGAELQDFFAAGMLLNVAAVLQLPEIVADPEWAARCLPSP